MGVSTRGNLVASPSESLAMRRIVRPAQSEMAAREDLAAVDTSKGFFIKA